MNPRESVFRNFWELHGKPPAYLVRAPGRVNLIGEHTDYNLGVALPMAIDRAIWIALRPREDRRVRLRSLDFPQAADFSLEGIEHAAGWADYVHGMARTLQEAGLSLHGWEGILASDLPTASGLSSSAALELALGRAFWSLTRWNWEDTAMAQAAHRMENEWLGLDSGIMDQLIAAVGQEGAAFLIDFRDLAYEAVPLPPGATVVVMDTRVPRGLVESAYNQRVAECRRAASYFGVDSLREVSAENFQDGSQGLEEPYRSRARHVIAENARTLEAAECMRMGDIPGLGALMTASHASLRDDYEVSCVELDCMVDLALEGPGCRGARMTGAGFGGCAIALVDDEAVGVFCKRVRRGYEAKTGLEPPVFPVRASNGVEVLSINLD